VCFGYEEPLGSRFAQRREVFCRHGTPRRAGAPARATALSDWLVCLGLPRPCAGEAAVTYHKSVLRTGTTRSREVSARVGVTNDEAENPPRLRVTNGEDSKESKPPVKRRANTHTASIQDSSTPVPWRWGSRTGNRRLQRTRPFPQGLSGQRNTGFVADGVPSSGIGGSHRPMHRTAWEHTGQPWTRTRLAGFMGTKTSEPGIASEDAKAS